MRLAGTKTKSFGSSSRANHDSSAYYSRKMAKNNTNFKNTKSFDKATGKNLKIVEVFVPVEEKGEKGILINRVILNGQELSSLEITQWVMMFVGDILKNKHH